jgi:putative ABC transport system permease protein
VDPGFDSNNLLSLQLFLAQRRYGSDEAEDRFYRELLPRLSTIHGVRSASMAAPVPFGPVQQTWSTTFKVLGQPEPLPGQEPLAFRARVSPNYFRTMGIPLLSGRYFDEIEDRVWAKKVAMVSEKLARTYWTEGRAIGQQISTGRESGTFEIVGVVGDVRHRTLDSQILPEIYIPLGQAPSGNVVVVLRTEGQPLALAEDLRQLVWSIDPQLPATYMGPVDSLIADSMAERRLNTLLLGGFTALAFALALVGIYGVISYIVSEGTREIGLRMALGAMPHDVFRQVIGRGVLLAAAGVAVGTAASVAGARSIQALLFQTSPTEPVVIVASVSAMLLAAAAACYVPARRATRVDPMLALRYE